ncbi:probable serine/threonine-protein kinase DDB_G0286465 [Hydra vulgaris]|uniref:probable serine/threonine-protein kinase DDB_G0286465 n=1 Tax=Hydra vulgaris TaxID=6087 RepID=UPI0001926F54|nr:probable serine/threonine-protein kinase DDB_G0286465 [Hydra vulgaris]
MNFGSLANFAGQLASNYNPNNNNNNTNNNNNNNNVSSNNKSQNNNTSQQTGLAIDTLLSLLPQEQQKTQKDKVFDAIGPLVKAMSPKWGDVIIGILKNVEFSKLLPLAQDTKELEKVVKEEELKLEKNEKMSEKSIELRESELQKELLELKEARLKKELEELRAQKNL